MVQYEYYCPVCGNEYTTDFRHQRFCSTACLKKADEIKLMEEIAKGNFPSHSPKGRLLIFIRDKFRCIYCGRSSIENDISLHVDHIVPRRRGGTNRMDNLITACGQCNHEKRDRELGADIVMRLKTVARQRNKELQVRDDQEITLWSLYEGAEEE